MPIGRYIAWVGTLLLVLLFVANWFFPQPLAEPIAAETNRPTIRITSMQQPPERIVIDTSLPTIVPPLTLAEDAIPNEQPPYASITSHATVTGAEKKKSRAKKKQVNQVASKHLPSAPAIAVASSSPGDDRTAYQLSFANIISGQLVRELFNLH